MLELYLIIRIQAFQIVHLDEAAYLVITETDPVIHVPKPDDSVVVIDGPIPLEMKTVANGAVITVPLFVIREASGQMSGHQADPSAGIIHPDRHSSFVARHSRHTSLLSL